MNMSSSKRTLLILVGVVVLLTGISALIGSGQDTAMVTTDKVKRNRLVETVIASGRIQPEVEVKISAEVSGQLIELPVKEGDRVEVGQLLARINPDIYESRLSQTKAALDNAKSSRATAKARLAQSKAAFSAAELAFRRNQGLHENGVMSAADFEQAQVAFQGAEADLEAAKQGVESAGFNILSAEAAVKESEDNLRRTVLLSPQSGTVTALVKEEGEGVQGIGSFQGEVIMNVSELEAMEVDVEVNESDIVKVELGDTARIEIDAYTDRDFIGLVTEIGNTALNASGAARLSLESVTNFSVKVRILPQGHRDLLADRDSSWTPFRPGMSATVEIETEVKNQVLSVPIKAVTTRPDTANAKAPTQLCLFLIENGKALRHNIETGIQDDANIELLTPLPEGADIITGPYDLLSRKLNDGDAVSIANKRPDGQPDRRFSVTISNN